jgi:hypothetical protein
MFRSTSVIRELTVEHFGNFKIHGATIKIKILCVGLVCEVLLYHIVTLAV